VTIPQLLAAARITSITKFGLENMAAGDLLGGRTKFALRDFDVCKYIGRGKLGLQTLRRFVDIRRQRCDVDEPGNRLD
jgi:hypothetical protein